MALLRLNSSHRCSLPAQSHAWHPKGVGFNRSKQSDASPKRRKPVSRPATPMSDLSVTQVIATASGARPYKTLSPFTRLDYCRFALADGPADSPQPFLHKVTPFLGPPKNHPFAGMDGLELCALSGPNAHEVVSPIDLLTQQDLISAPRRTVNDRFVGARVAP
jgi:hypothetical protein